MSVIVDSGDGHVALAIVRSLGRKNIETTVLSNNPHAPTFYSKYCSKRVVKQNKLDYYSRLTKDDVVMPVNDDISLSLMKDRIKYPCILPLPEYPVLQKAIDKSMLLEHAQEQGIPCPNSILVRKSDDANPITRKYGFPLILKPVSSFGGKGIYVIHSREQLDSVLADAIRNFGAMILQEKIPFTRKFTVGCLCNKDSKARRMVVLEEIRNYPLATGPACCVETIRCPEIVYYSRKLLESLGYFGIADIDFVIDSRDGKPKLLEINPRFWGSLQGAILAGVDFPYLSNILAREGDIDQSNDYQTHIRCRKVFFEDILHTMFVIKEHSSSQEPQEAVFDFLKFHRDNGYYSFDREDLNPFLIFLFEKGWQKFRKILTSFLDSSRIDFI
jgi:predicted ATP-grasp superfamily ATP-dependent carboligase